MYKGKKLAINLAGGGARGVNQLGFLKAIKDLELEPDIVCGTSVGALNLNLYAQDELEKLEEIWLNISNNKVYKWHLWTLPNLLLNRTHLYDSTPLYELLKSLIDYDKIIANKSTKYFVSSTNVTNWKSVTLSPQDCTPEEWTTWVYASASAPVYFQKTLFRGDYYADGGLANNFNTKTAVAEGAELIIVMTPTVPDLTLPKTIIDELDYVTALPSYDYLPREFEYIDLINTFSEKFPAGQSTIRHCLVRPPQALNIGLIDFNWSGDRKAIIQEGYDTAMATLKPWLDSV